MNRIVILLTLALGGCAAAAAPEPGQLASIDQRYLTPLPPLPETPAGAGGNDIMVEHNALLRGQCVADRRKVRALQKYARTVTSR